MAANIFYNRVIRKHVVGFGDVFNDIVLVRYNNDGSENQRIAIPLVFSPKEKYIARIMADPDLIKKVQIVLPRMSFDLLSFKYDADRKQQTNIQNTSIPAANPNSMNTQYVPVPYNLEFELYIYIRNIEDGTQIIEHILPYFTPEYTIKLNLIPEMNITKEIPINLNNVKYEVEYEGERDSPIRVIIWTLGFTMKGFIYGPVTQGGIIKTAITNIRNMNSVEPDGTMKFLLTSFGVGNFYTGEVVYQGFTLDTSTASGVVVNYSNLTNILILSDITGIFQTNSIIAGIDSQAEYILNSAIYQDSIMAQITSSVEPPTATANDYYTVVTTITEP